MSDAWELISRGGPVMYPLVLLSLLLYERCFRLHFFLIRFERRLRRSFGKENWSVAQLRDWQTSIRQRCEQENAIIGSMVAAAPLLGLLGTVIGMVRTFNTMADVESANSSEGLAEGISMALITTETGLAIAIPAVVIIYYTQRRSQGVVQTLVRMEEGVSTEN